MASYVLCSFARCWYTLCWLMTLRMLPLLNMYAHWTLQRLKYISGICVFHAETNGSPLEAWRLTIALPNVVMLTKLALHEI